MGFPWLPGRALRAAVAAAVTAVPLLTFTAAPANAAYGVCDTWLKIPYDGPIAGSYYRVPARTGEGQNCYLAYHTGSGNPVTFLQQALLYCEGLSVGPQGPDGIYGTATVAAVRQVQKWSGFPVSDQDGVFGPVTRKYIDWPLMVAGSIVFYNGRAACV